MKPYLWQYEAEADAHVREWERVEAAKAEIRLGAMSLRLAPQPFKGIYVMSPYEVSILRRVRLFACLGAALGGTLLMALSAHAVTIGGQARPIDLFTRPRIVFVTVTDMGTGETMTVRANPFGFYRVPGLKGDRTYRLVPTAPKSRVAFEPQSVEWANPIDGERLDFVYSEYNDCVWAPCG